MCIFYLFSALVMLVVQQKGHLTCKKPSSNNSYKRSFWG